MPTSILFTVQPGRNVTRGVMTLCPCSDRPPFMLHQQANNDANRNKEVGKREAGLEVGKRGPLPRLPCRCCSTPGSHRRIAPTSAGKRISCNKEGINKMMMNANVIHLASPCVADTSQISRIKGLKIKRASRWIAI